MNNKERITIHVDLIENLELQEETKEAIASFERKYKLKESEPQDSEVQYYSLSEIQGKVNEFKDKLNDLKNKYKDLHNMVG